MSPDTTRFTLGVLCDPNEEEPPSNTKTLLHLTELGRKRRIKVTLGNYEQLQKLDFDALLIRQTTDPSNNAYALSQLAARHKIPVIDDPRSIEICCDKLELMQRFYNAAIPTPKSLAVRISNYKDSFSIIEQQVAWLKYPLVVKDPASCFSRGVFKANDMVQLYSILEQLYSRTAYVQVQEYIPTRFDWRIGILNGRVLYCCQYNMAPGHWQVINHLADGTYVDGSYVTLKPKLWPEHVCKLAVSAAACVGNGLYGVDIKETKHGVFVIEVNDNPSIDVGEEDKYGNVWESILEHFRNLVSKNGRVRHAQATERNTSV